MIGVVLPRWGVDPGLPPSFLPLTKAKLEFIHSELLTNFVRVDVVCLRAPTEALREAALSCLLQKGIEANPGPQGTLNP